MTILIGAIADDFTGASDLASTLVREGMKVVQVIGVPDNTTETGDADAVVVALKSRTSPVAQAISESLDSLSWLDTKGAQQVVFKYCSTFDSTDHGNIGPVSEALRQAIGAGFALVCPAFPENGRTIYQGHLFVHGDLLENSSMRDHPLTPMRDSNLMRMMETQSEKKVGLIAYQDVLKGPEAIRTRISSLKDQGYAFGVVDAITAGDLRIIGLAAKDHQLVTGGSGVAVGLPANFRAAGELSEVLQPSLPKARGRQLVLAGSCSTTTRGQIAHVEGKWPTCKVNVDDVAAGKDVVGALCQWAKEQPVNSPVVIYGSADPEEIATTQAKYGVERAGEMVENVLGQTAHTLWKGGFDQIISAGGETSGAIVSALGVKALRICPEIAPGVPWTDSLGTAPLALALKSGNFGTEDFFEVAFGMLS